MLPSSNSAAGAKVRASPARRSSARLNDCVRRPTGVVTVRRASRAATVIAAAARTPGMKASSIACRMPRTPTVAEAISGPIRAPALSPTRSTPDARPYAVGVTRETSRVSRAGDRSPRDIQASAHSIATCHTAVARPMAAVAKAVTR